MANDQAKNATQEHPYPPTVPPYPQPFGAGYPPGYPIYYAQPPEAGHGDSSNGIPPGAPYMVPFPAPPGMMFPYHPPPPGQGFPQFQQPTSAPANGQRPKRKQVKMACTNCASACKRCDEARPCERCVKYGIQGSCVDGVRKERQKGIKRGPYKRKNKTANSDGAPSGLSVTSEDPEWQANGGNQTSPPAQPPPPIHAIPHYPPTEGYYPYFYPPPGFIPPGHDGQPAADGTPNGAGQPPPMVPYYALPPPGFFPYPPPGYPQPPNGGAVSTIDPAEASRSTNQPAEGEVQPQTTAPATGKKRTRAGKEHSKSKKAKGAPATNDTSTSGGTVGGTNQAPDPGVNSPVEVDDG